MTTSVMAELGLNFGEALQLAPTPPRRHSRPVAPIVTFVPHRTAFRAASPAVQRRVIVQRHIHGNE